MVQNCYEIRSLDSLTCILRISLRTLCLHKLCSIVLPQACNLPHQGTFSILPYSCLSHRSKYRPVKPQWPLPGTQNTKPKSIYAIVRVATAKSFICPSSELHVVEEVADACFLNPHLLTDSKPRTLKHEYHHSSINPFIREEWRTLLEDISEWTCSISRHCWLFLECQSSPSSRKRFCMSSQTSFLLSFESCR